MKNKMSRQIAGHFGIIFSKRNYIKSKAKPKKVTTNGNTRVQYPPPMEYTKKNAQTLNKNSTQ